MLVWLLLFPLAIPARAAAQILRAATFNVENFLETPSGTRRAKSAPAAAKTF